MEADQSGAWRLTKPQLIAKLHQLRGQAARLEANAQEIGARSSELMWRGQRHAFTQAIALAERLEECPEECREER